MDLRHCVAENLRRLRATKGLTQAQLAENADVNAQLVSDIETGRVWSRDESLTVIARALGISPTELFKDPELFDAETALAVLSRFVADKR